MAFERGLFSPSSHILSPASLKAGNFSSLIPTQLSVLPRGDVKRHRFNGSVKCSFEYDSGHHNQAVEFAKPAEIPWKKEFCNSISLIGNVGAPVEIRHLPSGKVVAWTRLAFKKSASETAWINLTFWDELAQVSSQHLEKGHQIYVAGRLISDVVESEDGKQQTYYKVVVQQLNFVEKSSTSAGFNNRDSDSTMTSRKFGNNAVSGLSPTELWQAFFANPSEWWDNRKNKRSPKYPDFKHKDTGEALWIEGRNNPPWVRSQLAILDERMGSMRDQDDRMHVTSFAGNDFMSYQ